MAVKKATRKSPAKKKSTANQEVRVPRQFIKGGSVTSKVNGESMSTSDPFSSSAGSRATSRTEMDFASERGRRGSEVHGLGSGPASTTIANSTVARKRSRYSVLTIPYAKRAVDILVSNVVGSGHRFVSEAPDEAFRKQVQELWDKWSQNVSTTRKHDFGGYESLAFRSMLEGGDAFSRTRIVPTNFADDLPVPMRLQLFEAEQVPVFKNGVNGKNKIVAGIEFTPFDMPTRYHMLVDHPAEMTIASIKSGGSPTVAVPAEQVMHLHDVKRPNEVRGLPLLSQSLIQLSDLDRYMDAELVRKKAAALIGGFITHQTGLENQNPFITTEGGGDAANNDEVHIEAMEPGTFPILPSGYDVKFSDPADVGINFKEFLRQQLLMIAAAVNITFEQLTGDVSHVNDRTIRATMLEFKRIAINYQKHIMVHQFCRPTFRNWFKAAVVSGALVIPSGMDIEAAMEHKWIADPWQYLNPQQEVLTEIKNVRAGFKSRSEVITERGGVPELVDAKIREDKDREEENELVFDTNAELVSSAGVVQSTAPLGEEEDEGDDSQPKQDQQEDKNET